MPITSQGLTLREFQAQINRKIKQSPKLPVNTKPLAVIDEEIRQYEEQEAAANRDRCDRLPNGVVEIRRSYPGTLHHQDGTLITVGDFVFPGISTADIARSLDMHPTSISRLFAGRRKGSKPVIRLIAAMYTDGNEAALVRVIQKRALLKLKQNSKHLTPEERNRILRNIRYEEYLDNGQA